MESPGLQLGPTAALINMLTAFVFHEVRGIGHIYDQVSDYHVLKRNSVPQRRFTFDFLEDGWGGVGQT